MITVTINRIRLEGGIILTPTPFTLYYKGINDSVWTLIEDGVYVDEDGYLLSSPLPSITIDETGYYQLRAVNDFCSYDYTQPFYINNTNLYEWVEDDSYCEQDQLLNVIDSITGFADPSAALYDEDTGRVYIADRSAITQGSNIYYFDPNTITSPSDITPVGSLNYSALAQVMDQENRMIYLSGADTGGLIAYNIATNTSSSLAFGSDGSYARQTLKKFGDVIICLNTVGTAQVTLIDAPSFTISASIPYTSIPNYTQRFSSGAIVWLVNGNWWVIASQGAGLGVPASSIGVYNFNFSTLIDAIPLPGQATWTNSAYWRTVSVYGDNMFLYDGGSSQLLTIDLVTNIVTQRHTFTNRQGKSNSLLSVIKDPITDELYASGAWSNDVNSDLNSIPITYKLNATFSPDEVFPDITYGTGLVRVGSTDVIVGASPEVPVYPSTPLGSATDGLINIFSKSGVGDNTGTKVVLTLQEVNTATGVPTGNVKQNSPSNPDYIPPYEDVISCPVSYTQLCPDTIFTIVGSVAEYEYSLAASTVNNPSIDYIELQQIDATTTALLNTITVPKNSYQHGYITKIGGNSNQIDLLFKDSFNNTLSTCVDIFTIP